MASISGYEHMSDEIDPENPRPPGEYRGYRDNEWRWIPEELSKSISLGPLGDAKPGCDWVLSYTPVRADDADREPVFLRLSPKSLHELYVETKGLTVENREMGHRAECDLCGNMVDLDRAIPSGKGEPCHRHCWADAYGAPDWFTNVL
jgi:diadenosine tetraphosphatase ApaH/serine/threonine PP2A family protein phosphatase